MDNNGSPIQEKSLNGIQCGWGQRLEESQAEALRNRRVNSVEDSIGAGTLYPAAPLSGYSDGALQRTAGRPGLRRAPGAAKDRDRKIPSQGKLHGEPTPQYRSCVHRRTPIRDFEHERSGGRYSLDGKPLKASYLRAPTLTPGLVLRLLVSAGKSHTRGYPWRTLSGYEMWFPGLSARPLCSNVKPPGGNWCRSSGGESCRGGRAERARLQRRHTLRSTYLRRLPAAGIRSPRAHGAYPDDGPGGSGFPLLKHSQRSQREGISNAGWEVMEPGFGLQDASPPDRNRARSLLHGGVDGAAGAATQDRISQNRLP